MRVQPLATNEIADNGGYTHICAISADDLTQATAAAVQTIKLADLKAGDSILKVAWRVKTFFKASADAAFNTTTMSVGNTATGVAAHIAAIELNENGTEVRQGFTNTAVGPYTAADSITATFGSMAAKSLLNINVGEVEILFELSRIAQLEEATSADTINK